MVRHSPRLTTFGGSVDLTGDEGGGGEGDGGDESGVQEGDIDGGGVAGGDGSQSLLAQASGVADDTGSLRGSVRTGARLVICVEFANGSANGSQCNEKISYDVVNCDDAGVVLYRDVDRDLEDEYGFYPHELNAEVEDDRVCVSMSWDDLASCRKWWTCAQ